MLKSLRDDSWGDFDYLREIENFGFPVVVTAALMMVAGCADYSLITPSSEVKTFFVSGQEADYLITGCASSGHVDMSAYSHLVGVKYPPTLKVDILSEPPARSCKSFAVLEYEPAAQALSQGQMEDLQRKAKEIGADALIIRQSGMNNGLPGMPPSSKMPAVAIKYKLTHRSS